MILPLISGIFIGVVIGFVFMCVLIMAKENIESKYP